MGSRRSSFRRTPDSGAERRLLLICQGSRGDIQPYVALASRLKSDGYRVMVFTNLDHVNFVKKFNLEAVGIFVDVQQMFSDNVNLTESMSSASWSEFVGCCRDISMKSVEFEMDLVFEKCCKFAPHLVIGTSYWGPMIGILFDIPVVGACLQSFAPTRYRSSPLNEPCCHYTAFLLVNYSIYLAVQQYCIKFRSRFEVPLHGKLLWNNFESFMLDTMHPIAPCIVAFSPKLFEIPPDWACTNTHFTGFWVVPRLEQEKRLSENNEFFGGTSESAVRQFLARGSAPVYMGWGSMIAVTPEHMTCVAVRTLKKLGMRGIILGGWAKLAPEMLRGARDEGELLAYVRDSVLFVRSAAHEWLFPQCAVTVHHGGAGTTAAALRSGRPTIVTPCWSDQFANANIVQQAGCGMALQQFHHITEISLCKAIRVCFSDQDMLAKCRRMSEVLLAEDGIGKAAKKIDDFYNNSLLTGAWSDANKRRQREHRAVAALGLFGRVTFALRLCLRRNPFPCPSADKPKGVP